MKTITTDDGSKFELVESVTGRFVLRPLQPAEIEKREYQACLQYFKPDAEPGDEGYYSGVETIGHLMLLSESQASALSDAVKALVEYTQQLDDNKTLPDIENYAAYARQAMQENK